MWWTFSFSRDLNIKDKSIQKEFWITDLKLKKKKKTNTIYDIFESSYTEPLYYFKKDWEDFEEYIKTKTFSNWNSEYQVIWIKKIHEIKPTKIINLGQGGCCPFCKSWNFEYDTNELLDEEKIICKCLDCKKESSLKEFEDEINL